MSGPEDPLARERSLRVLSLRAWSTLRISKHVDPDFIIVGAARAGTTGLLNQLRPHPGVLFCPPKEVHFFDVDRRWSLGPKAYRRHFATRAAKAAAIRDGRGPALSGENSPYYLAHPYVPERVRATVPDVRLIAILRDPTDRAISHWNWRVNRGKEQRSFATVVDQELPLLEDLSSRAGGHVPGTDLGDAPAGTAGSSLGVAYARMEPDERARRLEAYLPRGLYLEQLQRWHAVFPREQLLTLISERYFADPSASMAQVWEHLGLPPAPLQDTTKNARRTRLPLDPALVERVRAFYRPHNAALAAYLGEQLDWT